MEFTQLLPKSNHSDDNSCKAPTYLLIKIIKLQNQWISWSVISHALASNYFNQLLTCHNQEMNAKAIKKKKLTISHATAA